MLDDQKWPQLASVLKEGPSDTRGAQRCPGSDARLSQRSRASVVREGQRRGTAAGEGTVRHGATQIQTHSHCSQASGRYTSKAELKFKEEQPCCNIFVHMGKYIYRQANYFGFT